MPYRNTKCEHFGLLLLYDVLVCPQCLRQPQPAPASPVNKEPTGNTAGTTNQPPTNNQPPPSHEQLKADLTCGCERTKPAAVAAAQAVAAAGGDCNSPAGQALAQAYAQAVAAGKGQAVAQAACSLLQTRQLLKRRNLSLHPLPAGSAAIKEGARLSAARLGPGAPA